MRLRRGSLKERSPEAVPGESVDFTLREFGLMERNGGSDPKPLHCL